MYIYTVHTYTPYTSRHCLSTFYVVLFLFLNTLFSGNCIRLKIIGTGVDKHSTNIWASTRIIKIKVGATGVDYLDNMLFLDVIFCMLNICLETAVRSIATMHDYHHEEADVQIDVHFELDFEANAQTFVFNNTGALQLYLIVFLGYFLTFAFCFTLRQHTTVTPFSYKGESRLGVMWSFPNNYVILTYKAS